MRGGARGCAIALIEAPPKKRNELTSSQLSLDLWQNFIKGNYYYRFVCQVACPVGRHASA